jgi:ribokinase
VESTRSLTEDRGDAPRAFGLRSRVVVVGSVNVDLVIHGSRLPAPGETITGGAFERHHGGKGGNQAVAAARLGRPTIFVGAVGDDAFGHEARAALDAEGIDTGHLAALPGSSTGVALILVDEHGENLISVASGANGALSPATASAALRELGPLSGDVVLISAELSSAVVHEALRTARAGGATTILNPGPATGLGPSTLALADVLTPNRTELRQLSSDTSDNPEHQARRLLDALTHEADRPRAIVVTLGADGALLVERSAEGQLAVQRLPAPRVQPVDATGAGDAFNGALAAAMAEGRSLADAAADAVVAGALATTAAGAREGMPTPSAIRDQRSGLHRS